MFDSDGLSQDIADLIKFFGEKFGKSTFKSKTGEAYNPTTGTNTPVYDDSQAYMAGDEMIGGLLGLKYSQEYQQENMIIYVHGDDVPTPKPGDLISPAWLDGSHQVIHVDGDMYSIAWICHVKRKAE